jgi:hypothetical protein
MKLIDNYIYTVTKNLPRKIKAEVEKELRPNIHDMLPDGYNEADVVKFLYTLGNPFALAEKYQEGKRYLIGPELYGNYIKMLKDVFILVGCLILLSQVYTIFTDATHASVGEVLVSALTQTLKSAIRAAGWLFISVTIVFAVIERNRKYNKKEWPFIGKDWSISDLLEAKDNEKI